MIPASVFFILSIILGFTISRALPIRWFKTELAAASATLGLFISTWIFLISVLAAGYTGGYWIWLLVTLSLAATIYLRHLRHPDKRTTLRPWLPPKSRLAWIILSLAIGGLFALLLTNHMLYLKDGNYHSGGGAWGDLALHTSLISHFAEQPAFSWQFPVYVNAKLTYPFLLDFTSAILYRFGWTIQAALVVPGFVFAFGFVQSLFFFTWRLFKQTSAAALAPVIFLANGGLASLYYFYQDWQASALPLREFLFVMKKEYAHLADYHLTFSNIVADYFLPQRGILMGLAVFTLIITFWWLAWHTKNDRRQETILIISALLGGLTPFAHTHTFLVILGIHLWLIIAKGWHTRRVPTIWITSLLITIAAAAPQMTWQLVNNFNESFSFWQFGWMKPADQNIIWYWLRNMGLGFVFLFANFWIITRYLANKSSFYLHFYFPLFALFIITNLYIFQPHVYDNMKFMVYSYLGISLFAAYGLTLLFQKGWYGKIGAVIILVLLIITGSLSILRESYTIWQFIPASDIAAAKQFKQIVPPTARVLTSDQHNHFVPTLTGRPIIMGYRGWLWTYGINYRQVEQDVAAMYRGELVTPSLIDKYNISYVVIGPSERSTFKANQAYFDQHATLVMETDVYRVYDVRTLQ